MTVRENIVDVREIRLVLPEWMNQLAFVALLLIVFVGRSPFSPPAPLLSGELNPTGAGDAVRQVCYLSVLAVILCGALQLRGLAALRAIPPMLALLIGWCVLSASWAAAPEIALRRALLEAVLVVSVVLSVDTVGAQRSLALWRWVLGLILVVNLVSIPFVASAVHQAGEIDPDLVGDWRGLFGHKNVAGSVTAVTVMLFLFSAIERKKMIDWLLTAVALVFLVMTRSKSSLGLLPVALLAGFAYCLGWRRKLDRTIALIVGLLLIGAAATWLALDWDAVRRLLEDPSGFTGRTEIWQAELSYIRDHPFLGSGFGTFTDTGGPSPLVQYVSGDWVRSVSHGHSGYLQMLFMLGGIGLAFSLLAFIAVPIAQFWKIDKRITLFRGLLFSIFVFLILHNLLESDFFQDDGAPGVVVLLMMALLATARREFLNPEEA